MDDEDTTETVACCWPGGTCFNPATSQKMRWLCDWHWLLANKAAANKTCAICDQPYRHSGWCNRHAENARWRRKNRYADRRRSLTYGVLTIEQFDIVEMLEINTSLTVHELMQRFNAIEDTISKRLRRLKAKGWARVVDPSVLLCEHKKFTKTTGEPLTTAPRWGLTDLGRDILEGAYAAIDEHASHQVRFELNQQLTLIAEEA